MDFDTFAARAQALASAYPEEFLEGIDTVDVHRDPMPHPRIEGIYTLGECETSHLSDPSGETPAHSIVHLHYGSFLALAKSDETFDVEGELEETLAHEIQHHLEDRAGLGTLHREDALFEAHARFRAGQDTPAGWYRFGEPVEPGLWAVDLDLFLELEMRRKDWNALPGTRLTLQVLGGTLEVDVPQDADPEEIWSFEDEGLVEDQDDDAAEEDAPGEDVTGEDDAQDSDALVGALHVIPLVR